MKIIYSYNKEGFEEKYWQREIQKASSSECIFIPFNHGNFIDISLLLRAQMLDNEYYEKNRNLLKLYAEIKTKIREENADALLVDNCNPYHPEFLKDLEVYKILRTTDGPMAAYDRDFAYLHAFDHILHMSPAYSRDMNMSEKLSYCGAKRTNLWPLAAFEELYDSSKTKNNILNNKRKIDIVFIGALHLIKMDLLSSVKHEFKSNFILHGLSSLKKNIYFNYKYYFPCWVKPIPFSKYVSIYQNSKIGINHHLRNQYTVGGYRLFDLPANGVMQISDGGEYLNEFFKVGEEIESYDSKEELIDKIKYFLKNETAREKIALAGYNRVMKDHTIKKRLNELPNILKIPISKNKAN